MEITCLLIDADQDRRVQYYYALDLLGNCKACICFADMNQGLEYLQQHPDFRPEYVFVNVNDSFHARQSFSTAVQVLPGMTYVSIVFSQYDEVYFTYDEYRVFNLISRLKVRLQQVMAPRRKPLAHAG
ncbi:hypothetical protein SAMN05444266_102588 [Chitinophaga jiangningensis]|uniref:Response regulatory domain-containing protein n=1 Tax=Chitinophaga jiangningensis TaxID=1419482 RepID=A0A1M6Z2T5_9BACT|nr:hypothetical protein [Chitinophaga jiangningensis]SHL24685.1 hypothetical protein SAMN05444266_102588 [Chitinophaga jiangningensis]